MPTYSFVAGRERGSVPTRCRVNAVSDPLRISDGAARSLIAERPDADAKVAVAALQAAGIERRLLDAAIIAAAEAFLTFSPLVERERRKAAALPKARAHGRRSRGSPALSQTMSRRPWLRSPRCAAS
jgi:hypothetical protein